MKRILTSAFALLLLVGAAQAQTKEEGTAKKHREHKGGKELKGLNLTADQKAKMKAFHEQQKLQMEAIKNNTALTAEQRKAQMKELHQKQQSQMDAILTAEQKSELATIKAEKRNRSKTGQWNKGGEKRDTIGRRGGDRGKSDMSRKAGAGRGAEMAKELNLSAEQQQKVQSIQSGFKSQLETLKADQTLSKEQKQAKMQEILKAQQEQLKTVLTKEQQEKMASLRKERGGKRAVK
ncbi:MAG: hypothetical protein JWP69_1445 [Flaviaesturariibacter sp.]|nr:hypothetical protein [Flaviaesturariibacter sp.]